MNKSLLEYFVTEQKTYLTVVRSIDKTPKIIEISKGKAFWEKVKRDLYEEYIKMADPYDSQSFETEIKEFYTLGQYLIEPALGYLKDTELIYIVPHQHLHYFPFHALKIRKNRKVVYVIEVFQVVYLPSATVLKFCQNKNLYRQGKLIEKPLIFGTWAKDDHEDHKIAVQNELKALGTLFQVNYIEGLGASKNRLLQDISYSDLIHLACHGIFISDKNDELRTDVMNCSGLLLTDGINMKNLSIGKDYFLSANELLDIKLNCHLVTLSACQTGQSANTSGDELIGLSRALFYAGAPTLLLTLWQVNVESKLMIMSSFYKHWKNNMSQGKAKALQIAQIEMLNDKKFYSLYHWGAYCLIGDWL